MGKIKWKVGNVEFEFEGDVSEVLDYFFKNNNFPVRISLQGNHKVSLRNPRSKDFPTPLQIAEYIEKECKDMEHSIPDIGLRFLKRRVDWMDKDYDKLYDRVKKAQAFLSQKYGGFFSSEPKYITTEDGRKIQVRVFKFYKKGGAPVAQG